MKSLENSDKPNLLEDVFSHSLPPRIVFTGKIYEKIGGRIVTFDPRERVKRDLYITDTTFRDGQQARPPYTIEQITRLYEMLSRLGGPNGVIRQSEFFLYTKKDRAVVSNVKDLGYKYPQIVGWIRADRGDLSLVRRLDLPETGILTSCSDYHIFLKLKKNRKTIMKQYLDVVQEAIDSGIRPRCHLEDVTRSDIDGFVIPFVKELADISKSLPEHLKIKVRLCDTLGFGLPFPGVALPRSIPKLIYKIIHEGRIPPDRLEWHGHNDFHKVHVNAISSWLYGCDLLNATLLGFGERTGNPPLESAVIEYVSMKGDLNGVNLPVITEIAEYFTNVIGTPPVANYPFVGRDFNRTRAGIHALGLRRDERVYNIFDTTTLLGIPPRVSITDKSGTDGVAFWVNEFLGLKKDKRLKKTKLIKIMRWIMEQYNTHGRTTAISHEEMEEQVKKHLPEYYEKLSGKSRKESSLTC